MNNHKVATFFYVFNKIWLGLFRPWITIIKQKGPEYILEPNPDGPSISKDEIRKLERNDSLEFHQEKRVWWVKQKQDNVEFAGMLEATDESLGRIRLWRLVNGKELYDINVDPGQKNNIASANPKVVPLHLTISNQI